MPLVSWKKASMVTMSRPDMIQDAWKATWVWNSKGFLFPWTSNRCFPCNPDLCPVASFTHTKLFGFSHHSEKLQTSTSPVFSLTVVGRRVLPLEGGRGESMIIVGCWRLKGRPNNLQCFDFCRQKKGFRSEIPSLKKWSKGRKIILQIGLFLLVWKVEPCIYAVKFASLPIVLRECGARHRRIRWGGYNPWHIFVIIHTNK